MVPLHAPKRKEALRAPTHPRPLPGGEQAFVRAAKVLLLGGDRGGFMVPKHARKRQRAFHGPEAGAPIPPAPLCEKNFRKKKVDANCMAVTIHANIRPLPCSIFTSI